MLIAWIVYLVILAIWGIVTFLAISQVFKYKHPGLGVSKVTAIFLVVSMGLVVSSFIFMFTVDWDLLVNF